MSPPRIGKCRKARTQRRLPHTLSRLMIRIAWPDLRFCPGIDSIKQMAWTLSSMYRHADVRDYRIMLLRERCLAKGALAKTIELRLQGIVLPA